MVEIGTPAEGIDFVTFLAIRSEAGKGVIGFLRVLVVRGVTPKTRDWSTSIPVVSDIGMAIFAVQCSVSAKEGEPGVLMSLDHIADFP